MEEQTTFPSLQSWMAIRNESIVPLRLTRGSVVAYSKYSFLTEDNQHKNTLRWTLSSSESTTDSSLIMISNNGSPWMWKEETKRKSNTKGKIRKVRI